MFKEYFRKKAEDVLRRSQVEKALPINSDGCKRAVGFFPDSAQRMPEPRDTVTLRFHHLLVSLEGLERTGCLKVSSPGSRSRSAILLFRGRVVGCVYGRKNMRGQYLHQDAHRFALADLAAPGNVLDAYELPEEMVLAAASLFYGETLDLGMGQSTQVVFDHAISSLLRSGLPGTVVVNTYEEETICIIYIASGKIVGVFSAKDGWTHGTPDTVKRFVKDFNGTIHASMLPVFDAQGLGFSLSGLADRVPARTSPAAYLDFSPSASAASQELNRPVTAASYDYTESQYQSDYGQDAYTQYGRRQAEHLLPELSYPQPPVQPSMPQQASVPQFGSTRAPSFASNYAQEAAYPVYTPGQGYVGSESANSGEPAHTITHAQEAVAQAVRQHRKSQEYANPRAYSRV